VKVFQLCVTYNVCVPFHFFLCIWMETFNKESIVGAREISKKDKSTNESILSMFLTEMDGVGAQIGPASTDGKVIELSVFFNCIML